MACSNYWDSPIQVGDQQLARFFVAQGAKVSFISSPLSPLHFLAPHTPDFARRLANYKNGGMWDLDSKLWHYVPGALIVPHKEAPLDRPWLYRNWYRLTVPSLLAKLAVVEPDAYDIIYIRDPKFHFLLSHLKHRFSLFRMADKDSGFRSFTTGLDDLEKRLAQETDLVVYTARSLKAHVERLRPKNMMHLPNGVDFSRFADGPAEMPVEYFNIPEPRAVYVGSMEEWFDFELMDHLAATLPDLSFVLIGPDEKARARLTARKNLYILGRRPQDSIPAYLKNAQVGFIPFDSKNRAELVNHINPIKLYEDFACGLPVVSSEWEELRSI